MHAKIWLLFLLFLFVLMIIFPSFQTMLFLSHKKTLKSLLIFLSKRRDVLSVKLLPDQFQNFNE